MSNTPTTPNPPISSWKYEDLTAAIAEAGSLRKFAAAYGYPKSTVSDEMKRRSGGTSSRGRKPVAPLRPAQDPRPAYPDAHLVREAGADPAMWEATSITSTETDTDLGTMSSRRVSLKRRRAPVRPAQGVGAAPPAPAHVPGQRTTWIILSDQHAPHHDKDLHRIACAAISEMKPAGLLLLGDLMDLAGISRHQPIPNTPSVQDNIDMAFALLCDYRAAAGPDARMTMLEGNHDARAWRHLAENASAIAGVRQAGTDGAEFFSIRNLLRMDELGIEFIGAPGMPGGGYPLGNFELIPGRLCAIHGSRARKGPGNSAMSTAKDRGHGVVQGHTHRMGTQRGTLWGTDGKPRPFFAVEAGTMASIDDGMGYAPMEARSDWAQGFCVLTIWEDGAHVFEMAPYCRGSLTLRDRRYRINDAGKVVVS